jgi:tRNA-specific 2-thiouridylase
MNKKGNNSKKVYVGLSGGVDSSVSAAILKEKGYEVTGVFIKIWHPDFLNCNWKEEMRDAMRVCAKLDIPFKKIDLSKNYEENVIKYMINEYSRGRTPNPDVMCNSFIKFGEFYKWAIKDGADYVATGHYANIDEESLIQAEDENKDQTYFLWKIKKDQLSKIIFPIGDIKKENVRKLAKKYNLHTATKKDSQGLCFVGDVNMKDFLKKYIETKPGEVLNTDGEVIGDHDGSILFTIGERHGFTITKKGTEDSPYYVTDKNIEKNTITVSKDIPKFSDDEIKISNLNIYRELPQKLKSRIRYRQKLIDTEVLEFNDKSLKIRFLGDSGAITKGQSIVFYEGERCLGGGIIE